MTSPQVHAPGVKLDPADATFAMCNVLEWIGAEAASMRAFLVAGPPPFRPEMRREHFVRSLSMLARGYRRLAAVVAASAFQRCWCDARGEWWTDCGGGANYLCDAHKREAEAMPENAGVEFHKVGKGETP